MTAPAAFTKGDDDRVFRRHKVLELWDAPGRRQSGDIERFPDHDRDAKQRSLLAAGKPGIGSLRRLPRARKIADNDCIDAGVQRFNARDCVIREL